MPVLLSPSNSECRSPTWTDRARCRQTSRQTATPVRIQPFHVRLLHPVDRRVSIGITGCASSMYFSPSPATHSASVGRACDSLRRALSTYFGSHHPLPLSPPGSKEIQEGKRIHVVSAPDAQAQSPCTPAWSARAMYVLDSILLSMHRDSEVLFPLRLHELRHRLVRGVGGER